MSQQNENPKGNRVGVTMNHGGKGQKAGEEGAMKIDKFMEGNRTWDVNIGKEPKSVRKKYVQMYEALYMKYEIEYDEYSGRAKEANIEPKSESKLKRAPIGNQPEHIRAKYIETAERYFVLSLIDYKTYCNRVLSAKGQPKGEDEFDQQ